MAFNIGGMPDMINHCVNGYLAEPYETQDLANGLMWVIDDQERHQRLRMKARENVEMNYTMELQAKRYISLFDSLL